MCGIAGFVGAGGADRLAPMVASLTHRGPDDAGAWIGDGVALGMRRLAIIDVETGQQPMFNEDRSIAIVFNGEIYNFVELRERLLAAGHIFRSHHSDTEVIVHLYEEYGDDFLRHLCGMFAIAIWDGRRNRLLLARDHVGIKPLYYAVRGKGLVFGSELKAVLAHPDIARQPDLVALHHYFTFKNIPAPQTAFAGVAQLRPGEYLSFQDGRVETHRWWRIHFAENPDIGEAEAAQHIRALLEDSVRLQMRSDVPVGAYLSGGVDSSSVVALMSRLGASNIKTFTLVYDDDLPNKTSDRRFAQAVAKRYGTDHHEHVVRFQDVPDQLDAILASVDEPFSGVISTYFLTQSIAKHVKVALSGDGADELFGSYLPHRLAQPLAAAEQGAMIAGDARLAPFERDLDRLHVLLARGDEAARRMGQYLADDAAKRRLYTPQMQAAVADQASEALIRRLYGEAGTHDPLNRALFVDFETLLPDQVLLFVDRFSMAHSVEVRPPFLDHRLVEFAATVPGWMKIRQGRVKSVLKDAVADLLPDGLVDRPKEGFVMPINDWILSKLRGYVEDALAPSSLARHGLLNPVAVTSLLQRYDAGETGLASQLWNLVVFQRWWDRTF